MKRVVLAIPSGQMVHTDFAMCLARLMAFSLIQENFKIVGIVNPQSSLVQKGRYEAVEAMFKLKGDYLAMIDSDMGFPHSSLATLIGAEKDIIGCNYLTRKEPYKSTARDMEGNPLSHEAKGVVQCKAIGTGLILIKATVFDHIAKPYFNTTWDGEKFIGEDYSFCRKAMEKGFDIFCHTDLSTKVAHLGQVACVLGNSEEKHVILT